MSSPVSKAMGKGMQGRNPMQIVQEFQKFRQEMQGKNPTEELNKLLQSGKISQEHLNQAQQMAPLVQQLLKGML